MSSVLTLRCGLGNCDNGLHGQRSRTRAGVASDHIHFAKVLPQERLANSD